MILLSIRKSRSGDIWSQKINTRSRYKQAVKNQSLIQKQISRYTFELTFKLKDRVILVLITFKKQVSYALI